MQAITESPLSSASLLAVSMSLAEFRIDSIGSDRRLSAQVSGVGSGETFLVRSGGRRQVLVATTGRELAAHALELRNAKRTADAAAWFEVARTTWDKEPANADSADVRAIGSAWPTDDLLFAAALWPELLASRKALEAALATAPAKVRPSVLKLLLAGASRARAKEDAARWLAELEAAEPGEPDTFLARVSERAMAGDFAGREAACMAWLERFPGAPVPMIDLAHIAAQQGQFALASRRWRDVIEKGTTRTDVYNSAAWDALFVDAPTADLLAWATKAGEGRNAPWAYRHTLAAALANEATDIPRALEVFRGLASAAPEESVWVVPARLAHRLGLREEARELYKRIAKPGDDHESTRALAAKWLSELEQASPNGASRSP